MPIFRVRPVKPETNKTDWVEIEMDSAGEAINELHNRMDGYGISFRNILPESGQEYIYFAQFEVDGENEPTLSRIFHRAIYRKGGVRPINERTLKDIAEYFDWKLDPQKLIDEETWMCSESWDEAQNRKSK